MTTETTSRTTANGFTVHTSYDLNGHSPEDVLVTILVKDKQEDRPGFRAYYTDAYRLHKVGCRFVTRNLASWKSQKADLLRDGSAAEWAAKGTHHGRPLHTCSVCGTDTLTPGVIYSNETLEQAEARRATAAAERQAQMDANEARLRQENRRRDAERDAINTVLAKYADEVAALTAALTAQYLAETEA